MDKVISSQQPVYSFAPSAMLCQFKELRGFPEFQCAQVYTNQEDFQYITLLLT